ncbi:ABC transporter permease [Demequina sp. SO4-18]|uniref:ABC transporter permease n=1 Tax=Demequina sp. SO4-18 TaxID=3401026 RepID=UPI003B5C3453
MTATDRQTPPSVTVNPPPRTGNTWIPTPRGVALVTRIELLRRRPSPKGYVMYGILFAAILGLGILVAVTSSEELTSTPLELVLILVLGAGMLIGPSLSATSINGDSGEGVLAPLQMTHLTAGDLAVGKLLSSWLVSIAALVTMTPFLVFAYLRSGWHWDELLIVLAVILFVVLTATAIGLAWSGIAARAVASVSLAHLTTGGLLLGTLLIFAFTMPLVSEDVEVTNSYPDYEQMTQEQQEAIDDAFMNGDYSDPVLQTIPCIEDRWVMSVPHTDRTAWMLLINPVVVIGESAPIINPETYEEDDRAAPGAFATMHQMVSSARIGPSDEPETYDECAMIKGDGEYPADPWMEQQEEQFTYDRAPWLGLGVQALLLLGSMSLVIQRLRVPYKKLRTGTRVA